MPRYSVPLTTWANTTAEVNVPDDMTDPEQIAELAIEQNAAPTLCHQCASGGRHSDQGLELGDEWEPGRFEGKPDTTRID